MARCFQLTLTHGAGTVSFTSDRQLTKGPQAMKSSINRRTVGYCRISTEDQLREGVSLDAQEARIRAYCAAMEWPEPEVVRDCASAKNLARPGIDGILTALRHGEIERLIIVRLDRLTRSVKDLGDLFDLCAKHNTALVSITDALDSSTATGRLCANIMATVSQWEREICGERTAAALGHKRAQRQAYGRTPFGFRREGDALVVHPEEHSARMEAIAMQRRGHSLREIGRMLTECSGRIWAPASVRALLRSRLSLEAA